MPNNPLSFMHMTLEQCKEAMKANPPQITEVFGANAYFNWSWEGCGFGQLSFSLNPETGEISCMDECMGRERIRELLIAFANHVADNCKL